jgi:hypothetical protein
MAARTKVKAGAKGRGKKAPPLELDPGLPVDERMMLLAEAGQLTAGNADRHWCYEKSVQNVEAEVEFMDRVFLGEFGRLPELMREDFCGTALLCAEWVRQRGTNRALGVDLDGPTLDWGRANNIAPLADRAAAVTLLQDDVRNVSDPRADILAATNFSWWGFKTRGELGAYFKQVHASLADEGMFLMDCYGGPEAQVPQIEEKEVEGFDYLWDQDDFNPITGETRCMIHFRFPDGSRMDRAFVYDWRLWSLPEACDLLTECGFRKVVVYWEGADEDGEPNGIFLPDRKGDLSPAWVAYIIAFR